ncbi:circadian clock protein KaiA [Sphaerothrix gracilis]|uniref:circadian clock protein KaiA n=1 Tax=Sphaerothrix gracilis TaxID=3151835 RepID=UPI0031FD8F4C
MPSQFLVGIFAPAPTLAETLKQNLSQDSYVLKQIPDEATLLDWSTANHQQIDCLILQRSANLEHILAQLEAKESLLPIIVIDSGADTVAPHQETEADSSVLPTLQAVVTYLDHKNLNDLENCIHQAINRFVTLAVSDRDADNSPRATESRSALTSKQQKLAKKLKERLGYLGVYYKRNAQNFFRNMTRAERQELIDKLSSDYRSIVLSYFSEDSALNQKIDDYVNIAFFANIPVSQIVEIHMDLMDEFSKQLQLEGRSEEILLDYRLTLIDVIAHLCEMYRRSIPREP